MNFRFLVLLFLFPPCTGFSETLFEQFDLHKPIRSVDFSKSEDLKKQAKKHAEEENRLFKHEVLQKIKTGEHDVLLEKAFYSRNGIDRYRYSIKALNAKQEDIILWQMDYFTTSNRRFFGHLHYDESSGILRFASVRKDDVFYHPAIYEWEGARLVKRNIYSLSVLPDIKCDSLTYFEDQGFGYFCFSQKSGTAGKRDLFKLNTGDVQSRLWPAGGIAGALCAFVFSFL